MFYSSYGNIKIDKNKCSSEVEQEEQTEQIEQTKEKALNIINIFATKHNLENANKKILIKLINQDIDSYYDIFDKSDKKFYSKNLLKDKITEQSLKIEINRLINLIVNKSNFYITPQIKNKESNIIPQTEGGADIELKIAIRSLIMLGEKVANNNYLEFYDKLMLVESSLIRLHHAYHIFENSNQTKEDLKILKNTRKLIAASVTMGVILEYGYFKKWQDGLEQYATSLIQPYRFDNDILKIKRNGNILYYLLPKYKNYPKCILEEEIKDSNRINEQVNIFLIKIFSMKDDKDEFYKNCQEFKEEEEEVIEGFCNNKDKIYKEYTQIKPIKSFPNFKNKGIFYQANGKIINY